MSTPNAPTSNDAMMALVTSAMMQSLDQQGALADAMATAIVSAITRDR